MSFQLHTAGVSVVGGRATNQDAWHAGARLAVVADGVGGGPAGDVASRLAVNTVAHSSGTPVARVAAANTAVLSHAATHASLLGMATTLEVLLLDGAVVRGAHIGDSLVLHNGRPVARPHTLAEELVAAGHLDAEGGKRHPQGTALVRAVGLDADVAPDGWERPAVAGDRYLLATDGLLDALGGKALAEAMAATAKLDPGAAAAELVSRAEAASARDNVTVVIADVVEWSG